MRLQEVTIVFTLMSTCFVSSRSLQGYTRNKELGTAYKIVYRSQPWDMARQLCEDEGAKLAVPRSEKEFQFIQKLVRGMHYPALTNTAEKLVVWLGINNINDFRTWITVDGVDIREIGFDKWAGHNGEATSNAPDEPHCAALDAINPGLRDWWCHRSQPYICQLNLTS
ncbi:hemolymph lipopolysaccharide-binding protein-like [Battus philenor]|uniref:hemolymph lipopolysaccharide-binding protein-like n=1 Tax=Battus philenor TaxID=42288 RepID=UPI0035CEB6FD